MSTASSIDPTYAREPVLARESDYEPSLDGGSAASLKSDAKRGSSESPRHSSSAAEQTDSPKQYNEEYAELLRDAATSLEHNGVSPLDLPPTQLGAVMWSTDEKTRLYQSLSRCGRLDVLRIAKAVGSKSILEVEDYLSFIRTKERDLQIFEAENSLVSLLDIPAAIEVNPECEAMLEKAADALAAFQNQYDNAVGVRNTDGPWLIDQATALRLDEEADQLDEEASDDGEGESDSRPNHLFRVSNFLELSEKLFMNNGSDDSQLNWQKLGRKPAIVQEVVFDLYELVLDITRRLVQTTIFLALSRIRNSQNSSMRAMVKVPDVSAASAIIGLPVDLWAYWIDVPKRNKLNVIRDTHLSDLDEEETMSREEVEAALEKRPTQWRGRKSPSVASTQSISSDMSTVSTNVRMTSETKGETFLHDQRKSRPVSFDSEESYIDEGMSTDNEVIQQSQDEDARSLPLDPATSRHKKRRVESEQHEDEYLARFDNMKSQQEEKRLWEILGVKESIDAINEEPDLGPLPSIVRQTVDDMHDWTTMTYEAQWETLKRGASDEP